MTFVQLEDAALRAERKGAWDVAAEFWRRAIDATANTRLRDRARALRIECLECAARDAERHGFHDDAARHWAEASRIAFSDAGRVRYLALAVDARLRATCAAIEELPV
jgi:hypothetical protein